MNAQNEIDESQPKRSSKTSIVILILTLILLAAVSTAYFRYQKESRIASQIATAQQLITQRKLYEAIIILDQVIASDPNNVDAYRWRSIAYGNGRSNVYYEQQSYYENSMRDVNKLIELQPEIGNHYVDRNLLLRTWAEMINDSATKFYMYDLARKDTEEAIKLGVSPDYTYVYRHHARNLIESNHCEEGLQETQALVDQTLANDPIMDTYNIYLTEAYICLNQLDKAIESAERIQCDNPIATCRSGFMAEIYYQMEEFDKSLNVLNNMINSNPLGGAWRYFIRAAIFYEKGEAELAIQDLTTGDNYSWEGNGVYWYVKAKMAFDEGDDENGTTYLQKAQSTLDIQYTPLRQRIREELKSHGVEPLTISPMILFEVTPIP